MTPYTEKKDSSSRVLVSGCRPLTKMLASFISLEEQRLMRIRLFWKRLPLMARRALVASSVFWKETNANPLGTFVS